MDKITIAQRWLEKAQRNNNQNDIDEVMDKFFSLYVAYNAIYSKFSKNNGDDRSCATTKMANYLKKESITILNNCKDEILNMIKPVEDEIFHIYGNDNKQPFKQDNIIISKIKEDINNYRAILNFIYGIRCNMFHGNKQIIAEQKNLIIPANYILEKLIIVLIDKFITE